MRGSSMRGTGAALLAAIMLAGPALAAPVQAAPWFTVSTVDPSGVGESTLMGVSCVATTSCMAVGSADDGLGSGEGLENVSSFSERWDGTTWTLAPTAERAGSGGSLFAVSCVSPEFCIAVGELGSRGRETARSHDIFGSPRALVETWNGASWAVQESPAGAVPRSGLFGVSCVSTSFCVAVGARAPALNAFGDTLVEVWNGAVWRLQHTPTVAKHGSPLLAVSCAAADACMAVGSYNANQGHGVAEDEPLAERWNGRHWTIEHPPGGRLYFPELFGVSCPTARYCLASGTHQLSQGNAVSSPFAERWSEGHWAISTAGLPKYSTLNQASCSAVNSCVAVGQFDPSAAPPIEATAPLVEGWNGRQWARLPAGDAPGRLVAPPPAFLPDPLDPSLLGVSCLQDGNCVAVGAQASGASSLTLAQAGTTPPAGPPRPPAPVFRHRADVVAVSGSVSIRVPGSTAFVPLAALSTIPSGTLVDTTHGTVKLVAATGSGRRSGASRLATESGLFHAGVFRFTQKLAPSRLKGGHRVGFTVLRLIDSPPSGCAAGRAARSSRAHRGGGRLWGNAHGNFRTEGRDANVTVRGTEWLTEDSCAGTRVKVARGVVSVRDIPRHRTVLVKAPHSYLARAGSGR